MIRDAARRERETTRASARRLEESIAKVNKKPRSAPRQIVPEFTQREESGRSMKHFMRQLARKQRRLTRKIEIRRQERRRFRRQRALNRRLASRLENDIIRQ